MFRINSFIPSASISQKILVAILITSSIVSLFITTIQVGFDYKQEMNSLQKMLTLIEKSYSQNIAASLWDFHAARMQTGLDGIVTIPGIQYAAISEKERVLSRSGIEKQTRIITKIIKLEHASADNKKHEIGVLEIQADLNTVYNKIYKNILVILLSQIIKTFLVSILIYFIIQNILTKHLIYIDHYFRKLNLKNLDSKLNLKRGKISNNTHEDELDTLVNSINNMGEELHKSYKQLNEMNKALEEKVEVKMKLILEQRQKLEQASKMSTLGEMAGGIAHEINNPITIILGKNHRMRKYMEDGITDSEKYYKCFDDIDKTVKRIVRIINGLKIVSRDGTNDSFAPVKLYDVFEDVLSLCGEKLRLNDIDLRINLDDPVFQTAVYGSRVQLSQTFLNLFTNSYDAVENLPERWLEVTCIAREKDVVIKVIDSGPGIRQDIQEKIFQPFFTTKEIGKGTGLGLSISDSIIKNHHGTISLDVTSKNTCFVIILNKVSA